MDEYNHLNDEEKLKAENEFLKMKLMLEQGAHFGGDGETRLPAELENEFLKNVMAFEKQYEERKTIKLFDKIGRPQQFKPVNEIPGSEIDKAWNDLSNYLSEQGIHLDVCSPNISARELYRFTIEELFDHEMDDMNLPGWSTNFIYDEFHPNPVYESEKAVKEELFPALFKVKPVDDYFHCLYDKEILLNGKLYATSAEVKASFNRFKSFFNKIELKKLNIDHCEVVNTEKTIVSGKYKAVAKAIDDGDKLIFEGQFSVELNPDDLGYWSIRDMQMDGINFE
jgi:hypothetical protein